MQIVPHELERLGVTLSPRLARDVVAALVIGQDIRQQPAICGDAATWIRFKGTWLLVCRTDLYDHVATLVSGYTLDDYMRDMIYGVRIADGQFQIVDALTDG